MSRSFQPVGGALMVLAGLATLRVDDHEEWD